MVLVVESLSCVQFCDPIGYSLPGSLCPWDFQGENTGVGCRFFLQGVFRIQGLKLCLLHCRWSPALQMNEVKTFTSGKTISDEKIFKWILEFWKMYIHTVSLTASQYLKNFLIRSEIVLTNMFFVMRCVSVYKK